MDINISVFVAVGVCTYTKTSLSSSTLRALGSRSSSWSGEAGSSSNTRGTLNNSTGRQVSITHA